MSADEGERTASRGEQTIGSTEGESSAGSSVLDDVLLPAALQGEGSVLPPGPSGILVGEVEAERHPVLSGRVRVVLAGTTTRWWAPVVRGVSARQGDRVLLTRPDNLPEPVVIGVLDGFSRRPAAVGHEAGKLALGAGEVVTITAADGKPLIELAASDAGPVVRLLQPDIDVEVPGKLRVSAASIELVATRGEVKVEAADDVVVRGENVHLN